MISNKILCRTIETRDLEGVVDLLTFGYRDQRDRAFWERAVGHLAKREPIGDYPRFGYLLESEGRIVGVILLIFATVKDGTGEERLRCNLSSWYVAEEFRMYGAMLISRALRHREATYFNLTPAPHTFPILTAQGFVRYCDGRLIALPVLSRRRPGVTVTAFSPDLKPGEGLGEDDIELLRTHVAHGCLAAIVREGARRHPFVFAPRRRMGVIGLALLAYCRDQADFVRFAAPLGWFLLRRGFPLAVLDVNGPVPGLVGRYSASKPKYVRGAGKLRLGDTAFSERTMFGS